MRRNNPTHPPPKIDMSPEKRPFQKRKIVFQPACFRGYLSFREGFLTWWKISRTTICEKCPLNIDFGCFIQPQNSNLQKSPVPLEFPPGTVEFPQRVSYRETSQNQDPIGSMYGIFTYILLIFMVNVGKYTIHRSCGDLKNNKNDETRELCGP